MIDLEDLLIFRRVHQTKHAETGVRNRASKVITEAISLPQDQAQSMAAKTALLQKINEFIREHQADTIGIGTGMPRGAQWQSNGIAAPLTGNAANAAVVANSKAHQVCHCT